MDSQCATRRLWTSRLDALGFDQVQEPTQPRPHPLPAEAGSTRCILARSGDRNTFTAAGLLRRRRCPPLFDGGKALCGGGWAALSPSPPAAARQCVVAFCCGWAASSLPPPAAARRGQGTVLRRLDCIVAAAAGRCVVAFCGGWAASSTPPPAASRRQRTTTGRRTGRRRLGCLVATQQLLCSGKALCGSCGSLRHPRRRGGWTQCRLRRRPEKRRLNECGDPCLRVVALPSQPSLCDPFYEFLNVSDFWSLIKGSWGVSVCPACYSNDTLRYFVLKKRV